MDKISEIDQRLDTLESRVAKVEGYIARLEEGCKHMVEEMEAEERTREIPKARIIKHTNDIATNPPPPVPAPVKPNTGVWSDLWIIEMLAGANLILTIVVLIKIFAV